MVQSTVHLETIIRDIGGCGRYQILLSFIIHSMKTSICFSSIAMVFGAAIPDWWCVDDVSQSNMTSLNKTTNNASLMKSCKTATGDKCSNFLFQEGMKTIVNELDLVCDRAWIPSTVTSVQMAGVFLGTIAAGHVADLIGRKPPLFISMATLVVFNIVAAFSVSWVMFAVARFFIGLGCGFFLVVQNNLQSEFTLARWRAVVVALPSWAIQTCLYSLVVYLSKDWKIMHIVTASFALPFLLTWWFIPESFRWFVAHDRVTEARKVIGRIARFNGRPQPEMTTLQELVTAEKEQLSRNMTKYTVVDLFKTPYLLKITLLLILNWVAIGMVGYGIQFGIQALSGNLFFNIFLFGILIMPIDLTAMYSNNRLGRRKTALVLFAICAMGGVVVGIVQRVSMDTGLRGSLTNAFAFVAYIAISGLWPVVQTLTLEAYPTVVRSIGYGWQNMWARVGAVLGPQLVYLDSKFTGVLYFVCGTTCLLCVFLTLPLPETKDGDLQDKMADLDMEISASGIDGISVDQHEAVDMKV